MLNKVTTITFMEFFNEVCFRFMKKGCPLITMVYEVHDCFIYATNILKKNNINLDKEGIIPNDIVDEESLLKVRQAEKVYRNNLIYEGMNATIINAVFLNVYCQFEGFLYKICRLYKKEEGIIETVNTEYGKNVLDKAKNYLEKKYI